MSEPKRQLYADQLLAGTPELARRLLDDTPIVRQNLRRQNPQVLEIDR